MKRVENSRLTTSSRRRAFAGTSTALALAAAFLVSPALGAGAPQAATAVVKPVPDAVGYDYSPGEPSIWQAEPFANEPDALDKVCTGGYAIAGDSGFFLTASKLCTRGFDVSPEEVRGDAGVYGTWFWKNYYDPSVLVRMTAGNDAHQMVVDPITEAMPGDGRIMGWMPTAQQRYGMLVGKMGAGTGWTEGRILGAYYATYPYIVLCTDAPASAADIGGPVWRSDEGGLRALGTVAAISDTGSACYRPIQETLYEYGASLPTFGADQGRPGWGTLAPGLFAYDGSASENTFELRTVIDRGDDWRPRP